MTDFDRNVLEFYQLSTPYPDVWPAEKNRESDNSEDEADKQRKAKLSRRKSRYQALERAASNRNSTIPGAEKGNLVQRDEPDPLGTTDSVILALKRNGVQNIQDDAKLRNRFLLSSTTFSPALFLSKVHTNDSTESLLAGLQVLSQSIDQKSASLKVLVESNFERFVRAKATIDNVYKEMKYHGSDPTPPRSRGAAHSRHASRNSFRGSFSGGPPGSASAMAAAAVTTPTHDSRKRNALVKESEYGVMGIKVPLLEVSAKAQDVWGPALGGREKEETLRVVSAELDRFHDYVEISASISESIRRNDHETLVEEYHRARRFADEARAIVQRISSASTATAEEAKTAAAEAAAAAATDEQIYQVIMAARMWHDVEEQVQAYKRDVWRKLTSMHNVAAARNSRVSSSLADGRRSLLSGGSNPQRDQHMELIGLLLELGVEDNPIWVWLLSRYDYLKGKIQQSCDHTKIEIEMLRRRLAAADKPAPHVIAAHLRSLGRQAAMMESKIGLLDTPEVIELWEKIHAFFSGLLAGQGILGEVVEFWQTVEGFVGGKTQQSLPTGYRGESQKHHRLTQQGAADLQKGALELVDVIREQVYGFFTGPPPEDISLLFSPIPPSPRTPRTPLSAGGGMSPGLRDPRFNFDPKNPPPPSPRRGEAWEKFAFWPPWSNSISGVHYLSKLLALVGAGASEMATIGVSGSSTGTLATVNPVEVEPLRTLVGAVRERSVAALCAAWNRDAENIKYVEDWHRAADRRDVTKMPAAFAAFEGAVLLGMQKILYVSEAMNKPGAGDIVLPPPTKLLQMVRGQYVTTLYKALSGMVENAERPLQQASDDWTAASGDGAGTLISSIIGGAGSGSGSALSSMTGSLADYRAAAILDNGAFHAGDRNVRMLLTLSNLQCLRAEVVPRLNLQFENAFSVKLTDETKTIRDVLGQIDTRLFVSYTRPSVEELRRIIREGLVSAAAPPPSSPESAAKPREVRPFVYEALLLLVLVHSQVSTTAASLTPQVLSHLLEQTSRELLEAFRETAKGAGGSRDERHYDLAALMQATLDVEFIAQTLSQYATDRASELQGQIYQELDARTDNDARMRLQGELPEMRTVLKRLREASKNEFACFRKIKRSPGAATGGAGGSVGSGVGGRGSDRDSKTASGSSNSTAAPSEGVATAGPAVA